MSDKIKVQCGNFSTEIEATPEFAEFVREGKSELAALENALRELHGEPTELTPAELADMLRSGEWQVAYPPNARIVDGQLCVTSHVEAVTVTTLEVCRGDS